MRLLNCIVLALFSHLASAHYIWTTLNAGGTTSTAAMRVPFNNTPVASVTSKDIICGLGSRPQSSIVTVSAGSALGFKLDNTMYHLGPAAIYLGKVPSGQTAATWDGSGQSWFKIAEFGATFTSSSISFVTFNQNSVSTTIPSSTPSGDYLARVEQIGLHVAGAPQFYVSCGQITVTGGGGGNPPKVSIPGYVQQNDPGLTVNLYYPIPTSYKVPGPAVWRG